MIMIMIMIMIMMMMMIMIMIMTMIMIMIMIIIIIMEFAVAFPRGGSSTMKMEPSCLLWTTRCIPQAKFHQKPYNKSFIDQVCSVKMAGYRPRSFLRVYGPRLRLGP